MFVFEKDEPMKTRFYSSFLLMVAVLLAGCSPQINIVKITDREKPSDKSGVYYALPRTFVKVDVIVNKTEYIKGPYAEYAGKYLGLTNVIKSNSTIFEIAEYKLSTYQEPDPKQFYFVEMKNSSCSESKNLVLALDANGMLVSGNPSADQPKYDKPVYTFEEEGNIYPDIFKSYTDLNLFEKVDTIIEKVNQDSVMVEKMTFKRSLVEKTPEQRAKEAADFIMKVKDNRFNLISGFQEVNYDKETFKNMNDELEKMENEYRKLFTGIIFTKKITYSFTYLPDPSRISDSTVLFRFSKLHGMLTANDAYGEPISLIISKSGNTDELHKYQFGKDSLKVSQHGFYYRIPDYAEVKLITPGTENIKGKFLISQYGVLTSMPADVRRFDVFPETGGLKNLGGR